MSRFWKRIFHGKGSIARDVHEIKKDYIRIIQGIEEAIEEESNEETMSLQDLLRILESSTYRTMAEKKLDIRLMFDCRDNFMTQEHYQLMTILEMRWKRSNRRKKAG